MVRSVICGGFLSVAVSLFTVQAQADKPQRIVSLSVCGDQYVMGLAERSRIAALSEDARDPRISLQHEKAQDLPITRGNAEEILLLKPDLVIANRWRGAKTVEILKQSGIPVLMLSLPVTLEEIEAETRKVAGALGEAEKGEALLGELKAAMSSSAQPEGPRAAYFMPGGYSAGQNTFVETVLHSAGYRNLASEMGLRGWSSLALEELVLQKPDVLIMSFFKGGKFSLSTRLRQHSALREMMKTTPVIDVPDKYWACGGWFLFEAINYLKGKRTS
ncbi:ABC transporter substrate-binding protein [Terasakiella pusilla]|uniref:ABC transporter substrate-binding protein n=1 Tax=Terasakiella pusilla TaxID=64973 RepID=UPI003AA9B25E